MNTPGFEEITGESTAAAGKIQISALGFDTEGARLAIGDRWKGRMEIWNRKQKYFESPVTAEVSPVTTLLEIETERCLLAGGTMKVQPCMEHRRYLQALYTHRCECESGRLPSGWTGGSKYLYRPIRPKNRFSLSARG